MTDRDKPNIFQDAIQEFLDHGHENGVIIMSQATYDSLFAGTLVVLGENARIHINNEAPAGYAEIISEDGFLRKYGGQGE